MLFLIMEHQTVSCIWCAIKASYFTLVLMKDKESGKP